MGNLCDFFHPHQVQGQAENYRAYQSRMPKLYLFLYTQVRRQGLIRSIFSQRYRDYNIPFKKKIW